MAHPSEKPTTMVTANPAAAPLITLSGTINMLATTGSAMLSVPPSAPLERPHYRSSVVVLFFGLTNALI